MKKTLIILLMIFANYKIIYTAPYDTKLREGLSAAYNFDFETSEKKFLSAIELKPEDPWAYYFLSQNYLWFFLGSRDEGSLQLFEDYTDYAFQKLEKLDEDERNKIKNLELAANLYLQRAMVYASKESTLDAFFATKSAYSKYEDILEKDSTYARAYLGLGLLEYALSYVPGFFKWALSVAGLGSDKEKGLKFIRESYSKASGDFQKTEAQFHYAKILSEYSGDQENAIKLLSQLITKFPNNLLFRYQLAIAYIESRELLKAQKELNFIIGRDDSRFIQTQAFSQFLIGEINFRLANYENSLKYYDNFLEQSRGFEYSGIAYYNMALCNVFLNDTTEAKRNLLLARNGNSDVSDDLYAARKSEELFHKVNDDEIKLLILARNMLLSGKYKELSNTIVNQDILNGDERIEFMLILFEANLLINKLDEAKQIMENVRIGSIEKELWLKPYFGYLKALYYLKNKDNKSFERELNLAREDNQYDFKEKINMKLNRLKLPFNQKKK